MKLKRPVLRYPGGKFGNNGTVADWIVKHLPPHEMYVEPFGGAASVLLRKARSKGEVYNDLDDRLWNYMRVLRDPEMNEALERLLKLTPYSRTEFETCRTALPVADPVEMARRTCVMAMMGHGSAGLRNSNSTGFRVAESARRVLASQDWANYPGHLPAFRARLRGVLIENRPWQKIVEKYDGEDTLFYIDPPYLKTTRSAHVSDGYRHEIGRDEHLELAEWAHASKAKIVLSHYECPTYRACYGQWQTVQREVTVDSGAKRTEILWFNPEAARTLLVQHRLLF